MVGDMLGRHGAPDMLVYTYGGEIYWVVKGLQVCWYTHGGGYAGLSRGSRYAGIHIWWGDMLGCHGAPGMLVYTYGGGDMLCCQGAAGMLVYTYCGDRRVTTTF